MDKNPHLNALRSATVCAAVGHPDWVGTFAAAVVKVEKIRGNKALQFSSAIGQP